MDNTIWEIRNAYKCLVIKPEENISLATVRGIILTLGSE
jgi:hypothetical protein